MPLSGLDRIRRDLEGAGVHSWARRVGDHLNVLLALTSQLRAVVSERRPLPRALVKIAVIPIVEAAIDAAQLRAKLARVALTKSLSSHHPHATVLGDPISLRRVLDNLISNALDATSPGGSVIVELWDEQHHPAWLTITVHDSGRGLGTAAQEPAADLRFAPTRRAGMGLGLGIVRELTEAMEGMYGAEPNSRGGSNVWIRLQRAEPVRAVPRPSAKGTDHDHCADH
jgi:signal transduction histidine kinase